METRSWASWLWYCAPCISLQLLQKDFSVPQRQSQDQLDNCCLQPGSSTCMHQGKLNQYYFISKLYICATKMLLASPLLSPAYLPGHPVNRTDILFLYCSLKMCYCAMYSKATTMTHAPINALTHSSRGYLISLVTSLSFRLYFSLLECIVTVHIGRTAHGPCIL
jgi:hypothetical protein